MDKRCSIMCARFKEYFITLAGKISSIVFVNSVYNSIRRVFVSLALLTFVVFILLLLLHKNAWLDFKWPISVSYDYFFAVYLGFTFILFYEIIAMIFVIPQSVAKSVGKQYEIISLIILRTAFEHVGKYRDFIKDISLDSLIANSSLFEDMLAGTVGPFILFLLVSLYYSVQKHTRIISDPSEYRGFVAIKQGLSFALILIFVFFILIDIVHSLDALSYDVRMFTFGHHFFKDFFTIMIFVDIFLVLVTIRYSSSYDIIFRNSGLAISTVLIRLSFASDSLLVSVLISIFALLIGLFVSVIYNRFQQEVNK